MSIFSSISKSKVGRNKFDLSYWNYLTCNMGDVVPFYCEDLVPGDKFKIKSDFFARLMPLQVPAFQNLNIYAHYFFIPYRLVWDEWEDFITNKIPRENGQHVAPVLPWIKVGNSPNLFDCLGMRSCQTEGASTAQMQKLSSLRLRAYWLLYNEWYRDQNVDFEVNVPKSSGEDYPALWTTTYSDGTSGPSGVNFPRAQFFKKRYGKDYFTSALPFPQLQDVTVPLAGYADISFTPGEPLLQTTSGDPVNNDVTFTESVLQGREDPIDDFSNLELVPGALRADLTRVTSATINDLRRAVALQHFFELSARGGNRYIEQMLAHFGVHSKDSRLQRPEFLGGGVTPIQIGEVLQTSQTTSDSSLGDLAGRGFAINNRTNNATYYATEHGILMGVMSIMPESLYWQGINRHLQKFDPIDYYFPSFAHLGEQEVKNKELYYKGDLATDEATFGYSPRYAEYKHHANEVHGDFIGTLKQWHFGREFSDSPKLNSTFLSVPDITNPFAVQNGEENKYLFQIRNNVSALRPMPYYSNPKLIG